MLEGVASCVVIAMGPYSFNGKTMLGLRTENAQTPLQMKLNELGSAGGGGGTTVPFWSMEVISPSEKIL